MFYSSSYNEYINNHINLYNVSLFITFHFPYISTQFMKNKRNNRVPDLNSSQTEILNKFLVLRPSPPPFFFESSEIRKSQNQILVQHVTYFAASELIKMWLQLITNYCMNSYKAEDTCLSNAAFRVIIALEKK